MLPCHGNILYFQIDHAASEDNDTLTIVFTGDILLDRGVRRVVEQHGADTLFTPGVDSVLRSADVVVGNLECPATKIHAPVLKRYMFRAEPDWLTTLYRHGFTHLNLANNHSIDQGRRGLADTWQNISLASMVPIGAGPNMEAASQPVLLASSPRKVYLLTSLRLALENFAYLTDQSCVSQEPSDSLISHIRAIKQADSTAVILVSLHWGGEHTLRPVPQQRMEARRLIDAGADALICHHTHTLQTIEHYRGRPVYYSIGNFIFDQHNPLNAHACMVRLHITAHGLSDESIPIIIRLCTPHRSDDFRNSEAKP